MPGGHSGEVIPVPIPNTEVKLSYADDTAFWWESRKLPGFFLSFCIFWAFFDALFFCAKFKIAPNARRTPKYTPKGIRTGNLSFFAFEAILEALRCLSVPIWMQPPETKNKNAKINKKSTSILPQNVRKNQKSVFRFGTSNQNTWFKLYVNVPIFNILQKTWNYPFLNFERVTERLRSVIDDSILF